MTSAETLEGVRKAKRSKEMGMWKLMNGGKDIFQPSSSLKESKRHENERVFQSQKEGTFNKHTRLQTKGLCTGRRREELMSISAQQRSLCVFPGRQLTSPLMVVSREETSKV